MFANTPAVCFPTCRHMSQESPASSSLPLSFPASSIASICTSVSGGEATHSSFALSASCWQCGNIPTILRTFTFKTAPMPGAHNKSRRHRNYMSPAFLVFTCIKDVCFVPGLDHTKNFDKSILYQFYVLQAIILLLCISNLSTESATLVQNFYLNPAPGQNVSAVTI